MSEIAMKIAAAFDALPESLQDEAHKMLCEMLRKWDSDFTKLTLAESIRLDLAESDTETVSIEEVEKELKI